MLKNLFKKKKEVPNTKNIPIIALLVHAAKIDENYTNIEKKIIKKVIAELNKVNLEESEKLLTGVMMIAYADRSMKPLEVRWASMLASAVNVTPDVFQRCCVNARIIASMLRPSSGDSS